MIEDPVAELERHYRRARARERHERVLRWFVAAFTLAWYGLIFGLGMAAGRCTAHP